MSRPLVDIRLEGLSTRGGKPPGLDSISVHVRYGEFFTFLGPPHSGKTDVLQAVAGFMPPSQGRILVDGQDVAALPPGQRSVGYVFQEGALWPHMTAVQHVAFGLEQQGMSPEDIERRVAVVGARLELCDRATRPPEMTLVERRRLALARALAVEPRILLLDEPLAHLDPISRKTLRLELARLHRDLAVTTIHVTRDAADAQRQVERDRPGGDRIDLLLLRRAELHDRAATELLLDRRQRGVHRLAALRDRPLRRALVRHRHPFVTLLIDRSVPSAEPVPVASVRPVRPRPCLPRRLASPCAACG